MCEPKRIEQLRRDYTDLRSDLPFLEEGMGTAADPHKTERLILKARLRGMKRAFHTLHPDLPGLGERMFD